MEEPKYVIISHGPRSTYTRLPRILSLSDTDAVFFLASEMLLPGKCHSEPAAVRNLSEADGVEVLTPLQALLAVKGFNRQTLVHLAKASAGRGIET